MLVCVGLSHKQVPIAVRERLAVPKEELPARLTRIRALPGVREAMLLSTCNRLEIFAEVEALAAADELIRDLGDLAAPHARVTAGDDALLHILRVASSLDSMVVGEAQIQGQLKDAASAAHAQGALGPNLSRAIARAMSAAKRVRTETAIARGAVSVSSVAVQMAKKLLGDLAGKSVMLLGAGEMAKLAARDLKAENCEILVANRNPQHAEQLARDVGGIAMSLTDLPALLERVDVAVCSVGAQEPVVTCDLVRHALRARRFRPLFLIDLAVPRNVEPAVNELENVYVYDMDDLERVAAQNRGLRENEVGRAEEIVREEVQAHLAATLERKAIPVLGQLRKYAEAIARVEADRTLEALDLSEPNQKCVRAMAQAIVNKLLHGPTARLRAEGGGPLSEAVAVLFELEEPRLHAVPDTLRRLA